MVKNIVKLFFRKPDYLHGIEQNSVSKKFVLTYGKNDIGYLEHGGNQWKFVYSEWFKQQDRIQPLVEFPKKNVIYKSPELWSFFSSRIPSAKQLKVGKSSGRKLNMDELLEKFGKQTINNPFVLETA